MCRSWEIASQKWTCTGERLRRSDDCATRELRSGTSSCFAEVLVKYRQSLTMIHAPRILLYVPHMERVIVGWRGIKGEVSNGNGSRPGDRQAPAIAASRVSHPPQSRGRRTARLRNHSRHRGARRNVGP